MDDLLRVRFHLRACRRDFFSAVMNLNWVIFTAGLAIGAAPTYWVTSTYYQKVIAKEHEAQQVLVIEQQEKSRLALLAYAERIVKAGADHDKNAIVVRNLRRELNRVRIQFPACPVPDTTEGGGNPDEASGILPNPVDALFERLQGRTGSLIEEADELNIDAIRANQTGG